MIGRHHENKQKRVVGSSMQHTAPQKALLEALRNSTYAGKRGLHLSLFMVGKELTTTQQAKAKNNTCKNTNTHKERNLLLVFFPTGKPTKGKRLKCRIYPNGSRFRVQLQNPEHGGQLDIDIGGHISYHYKELKTCLKATSN